MFVNGEIWVRRDMVRWFSHGICVLRRCVARCIYPRGDVLIYRNMGGETTVVVKHIENLSMGFLTPEKLRRISTTLECVGC